jgi:hypothetical protein
MADPTRPPKQPDLTPRAQAALEERRALQAEALRENLRRRKQQARNRGAAETGKTSSGSHPGEPGKDGVD